MLTAQRLRELLHYDPNTGVFTRRIRRANAKAGDVAGHLSMGYLSIGIDYRKYQAHRLAWLYMTGEWADGEIDHRDMNRANNKWDNLRAASKSENGRNVGMKKNNVSGFKGVSWDRDAKRWSAHIMVNRKSIRLGRFESAQLAHDAYCAAAEQHHGEFARVE